MSGRPVIVFLRSYSVGYEPLVGKRARAAAEAGLQPVVVYWQRGGRDIARDGQGISYRPIAVHGEYGRGVMGLVPRLRFLARAFFALCRLRPAAIHACDMDMMLLACFYKCTRHPRIPLVYDILDFIYDFATPIPRVIRAACRMLDSVLCRVSTVILLPDENRLAMIPASARDRVTFIYNAPDVTVPLACGPEKKNGDKLTIFYAGNFGPDRGLPMLMEVVAARPRKYRLVLAGPGPEAHVAEKMASLHENIEYLGPIDFSEVARRTVDADLLYAAYDPASPINRVASPNKFFEAVTFSKPILVTRGTSIDEKVKALDCGWVTEYSPAALGEILDRISAEEARDRGKNAARGIERYGWPACAQALRAVYTGLICR